MNESNRAHLTEVSRRAEDFMLHLTLVEDYSTVIINDTLMHVPILQPQLILFVVSSSCLDSL